MAEKLLGDNGNPIVMSPRSAYPLIIVYGNGILSAGIGKNIKRFQKYQYKKRRFYVVSFYIDTLRIV